MIHNNVLHKNSKHGKTNNLTLCSTILYSINVNTYIEKCNDNFKA